MPHTAGNPRSTQSHLSTPQARPLNGADHSDFVPFPEEDLRQSVGARFEQQALRHPSHLAIKTDAATISYRELNALANRLARAIQACPGTSPGARQQPVAYLTDGEVTGVVANLDTTRSERTHRWPAVLGKDWPR